MTAVSRSVVVPIFFLIGVGCVDADIVDCAATPTAPECPTSCETMPTAPECQPPPGTRCGRGRFTDIRPVDELGTVVGAARLSADGLTIYFESSRLGGSDLYVATRPYRGALFENVRALDEVNTAADEDFPSVASTADGLALYALKWDIARTRSDVYVSSWDEAAMRFGSFVVIPEWSLVANTPFVTADASALYSVVGMDGDVDVYRTPRGSTAASEVLFEDMDVLGANEGNPIPTRDELAIYFSSNRSPSIGGYDIYVATRTDVSAPFGVALNLIDVNTPADEFPSWVSEDQCELFFVSDRLYRAARFR